MKKKHQAARLILPLAAATTLLASCIIPEGYFGDGYQSGRYPSNRYSSDDDRYAIYRSLPSSFSGNAYYYDGRYYTGGDYQTGSYIHMGRHYTSRYNYKGSYLYGGRYQGRESGQWTDPRQDNHRREDYRR